MLENHSIDNQLISHLVLSEQLEKKFYSLIVPGPWRLKDRLYGIYKKYSRLF